VVGRWANDVLANTEAACALTKEGHAAGVASEGCHVALCPLQAESLVLEAVVSISAIRRLTTKFFQGEPSERVETVIYCYNNHAVTKS
jgi:hypothetical protein